MSGTNRRWLNKQWRGVLLAVLGVLLCFVGVNYALIKGEVETLEDSNARLIETLENQTAVILDLRGKLQPRDFESLDELQRWVSKWNMEHMPVFVEFLGLAVLTGGDEDLAARYADCDNFAEAMQRDALWDGYRVSVALVDSYGTVYGAYVSQVGNHAGNIAVAGNAYYFIEPQTGEIVFIINRD